MGKNLYTHEQQLIFAQVGKEPLLQNNFYFTGGTALSYFYLRHRYSEDLDFFSEKKFEFSDIEYIVKEWAKALNFTYEAQLRTVVAIFSLKFPNNKSLKVDFGYYPYKRVETGARLQGVMVDSLLDIAVNKLSTINQRTQVKDFVDLYYLLEQYTLWDLIEGVRIKFRQEIEPWLLSADLSVVQDFTELPRMIKPLTLAKLKTFYLELAQKLARTAVE